MAICVDGGQRGLLVLLFPFLSQCVNCPDLSTLDSDIRPSTILHNTFISETILAKMTSEELAKHTFLTSARIKTKYDALIN